MFQHWKKKFKSLVSAPKYHSSICALSENKKNVKKKKQNKKKISPTSLDNYLACFRLLRNQTAVITKKEGKLPCAVTQTLTGYPGDEYN